MRKAQTDVMTASAKMAEASARMFRYQKIVDNLKNKSLKELNEIIKKIKKKGKSDKGSSSVDRRK